MLWVPCGILIKFHLHYVSSSDKKSAGLTHGAGSRIRTCVGIKPTVLQTVPFGHFGIPACGGVCTGNVITSEHGNHGVKE